MKRKSAIVFLLAFQWVFLIVGQFTTKPDTWAGSDGLGRILPTRDQVGGTKPNKFVGIFYFLWTENVAGFKTGPHDATQIMSQAGEDLINAQWGPLYEFHHWGKPYLDYYLMDDEFVIRKHGQMLADAGVDTLIFDVTNAETYDNIWSKIGDIYSNMRSRNIRTPQFCFITWTRSQEVVQRLYNNLYRQNRYSDLWFRWNGKPLIFADPDGLSSELRNFFTIRKSWAWTQGHSWYGDGRSNWPWIDDYPQGRGLNEQGQLEETCVAIGGHPTSNIGRSFDGPSHTQPSQGNPNVGKYFSQQWDQALKIDPSFIFLTGWNEWIAQRFVQTDQRIPFLGKQWPVGTTFFVDQFNQEYSRDAEPMADGHGDNYYYQLVNYIRHFKGMQPPESVSPPKTITLNQDFTQWHGVTPFYLDDLFDTPSRNHPRYGNQGSQLTDYSQKNDLAVMQVARDATNLYFYARAREPWVQGNAFNWLLLNTDNNYSTGWLGFDYLVDLEAGELKRSTGFPGQWQFYAWIVVTNSGNNELHFGIPYQFLHIGGNQMTLQFKWLSADHLYATDPLNFIDKGDAAPNGRFTYTYSASI